MIPHLRVLAHLLLLLPSVNPTPTHPSLVLINMLLLLVPLRLMLTKHASFNDNANTSSAHCYDSSVIIRTLFATDCESLDSLKSFCLFIVFLLSLLLVLSNLFAHRHSICLPEDIYTTIVVEC